MSTPETTLSPLSPTPTKYLAALDMGSNSFHFVLARVVNDVVQTLHAEKYRVKLADGLDENNNLSETAILRGISALESFVSATKDISQENIKVVATYTLRKAKNAQKFLDAAAKVFPFDIEIISGHEEARLIYQGVAHNTEPNGRRLVVDIGGGSTECIIGEDYKIDTLASLPIGCVNFQQRFFADNHISAQQFDQAITAASIEIKSIIKRFSTLGWHTAIGTSGTIKSIFNIINFNKEIKAPVTLNDLLALKKKLIACKQVSAINIDGLKESRQDVICSGLAILIALMKMLCIDAINHSRYALREGVLSEQLDFVHLGDVRQRAVNSIAQRFSVDIDQADSVSQLAHRLYLGCKKTWQLTNSSYCNLLRWGSQLHELGVDINPSGYHKHGQYIIEHADLAGFNQEQQQALAWLIGCHRKKFSSPNLIKTHSLKAEALIKIALLLRLSVLLMQQRNSSENNQANITASNNQLTLTIPKQWLLNRPLIDNDLFFEQKTFEKHQIELIIRTI